MDRLYTLLVVVEVESAEVGELESIAVHIYDVLLGIGVEDTIKDGLVGVHRPKSRSLRTAFSMHPPLVISHRLRLVIEESSRSTHSSSLQCSSAAMSTAEPK